MSDKSNDRGTVSEKGKLSMTLGLGFALGVAAFGLSDTFFSESTPEISSVAPAAAVPDYTCSMHPQIRQPDMGPCPLCGMDLIPASSG